ncbi:Serine/threonine-protein phosphatase BSL1 [Glycine max]|nr:Serine/threonine-protein phosphatase BSL1 [Glycine max]
MLDSGIMTKIGQAINHCLLMQTCCQLWFQDMKPHFALGRNRELQGLARAMVKRWETSAIQKLPSNELFLIHVMKHYCFEELRPIADAYGLLMHRNGPLHLEFPLHQGLDTAAGVWLDRNGILYSSRSNKGHDYDPSLEIMRVVVMHFKIFLAKPQI